MGRISREREGDVRRRDRVGKSRKRKEGKRKRGRKIGLEIKLRREN